MDNSDAIPRFSNETEEAEWRYQQRDQLTARAETALARSELELRRLDPSLPHRSLSDAVGEQLAVLGKRFGLQQAEMSEALGVTERTVQDWKKGIGSSRLELKIRALEELTKLLDDYVSAPLEQEWLSTQQKVFENKTPRELIAQGRVRDLIAEFLRLREGQPL